jgi:hypothetical protein
VPSASGPVAAGQTRYSGTVTDAANGAPIAGVCVYAGPPAGCPSPSLVTDAAGRWAIDFPSGFSFSFNFEHPAYVAVLGRTGTAITVAMTHR